MPVDAVATDRGNLLLSDVEGELVIDYAKSGDRYHWPKMFCPVDVDHDTTGMSIDDAHEFAVMLDGTCSTGHAVSANRPLYTSHLLTCPKPIQRKR